VVALKAMQNGEEESYMNTYLNLKQLTTQQKD
jgi:hypothetical protein